MKKRNKQAFTLIELLLVVLIIGILAAVAVPQYTKAVEKARTREAVLMLKNMQKAWQLCRLQYGDNAEECGNNQNGLFSHMDIEIPGTLIEDCDSVVGCYLTKDWIYDFDGGALSGNRVTDPEDLSKAPYYLDVGGVDVMGIRCKEFISGACKNVCGSNGCTVQ